jgi:MFS family permease
MTRSPFWLGVVATAGLFPTLFAGLLGGVMADRVDRLRLTATTQALSFVITFALFLFYQFGWLNIGLLIVFKLTLSTVVAISQPARMALIPNLVGREQLGPAVSFGSMVFNSARFVGPAVAALIIAQGGMGVAFLINSLTFLAMSVALLCLRVDRATLNEAMSGRRGAVTAEIGTSIGYVVRHGGALTIFGLVAVVTVTCRPISDFLPAVVTHVFGRGVEGVAILTSSVAAGSILGGLWSAGRELKGLTASALMAAAAYAVCLVLFVSVTNFWVGCAAFATAGFFTTSFGTAAQTLVQASAEESMRGRVMSLWFILSRGGPDLGAFIMGVAGELVGLRAGFIGGAAVCLGAVLWAWRRRSLLAAAMEVAPERPVPRPN